MRALLICVGFLCACTGTAQSPWARAAGSGYLQVSFYTIPTYDALFGSGGEDIELVRYVTEQTLQLYGEYGLTSRTTAVLYLPLRMHQRGARTDNPPFFIIPTEGGQISGIGNVSLALRHQLLSGPLALSGNLRIDLPSTAQQSSTGLRTGFDAFTFLPSLSLGQGLGRAYWFVYGGLALRTNRYNHYLTGGAEAGFAIGPLWLIAFGELVLPLENDQRPLNPTRTLTGLYENNQGWLSPGVKAIWQATSQLGIVVSGAGALWAQYAPKSPSVGIAAFFRWE